MTSRERVRAALNHKKPDMVPVSIGASIVDGFTRFAKDNFENYLGMEATPHVITHKPMGTVITSEKMMLMYGMESTHHEEYLTVCRYPLCAGL